MLPIQNARRMMVAATVAVAAMLMTAVPALSDAAFQRWVQEFRSTATQNGITGSTFDRAFSGITAPDPDVLRLAQNQPEFTAPVWQYFDNQVTEEAVQKGRELAVRHRQLLDRVEQRFGVERHVLLAIWSVESRYGEALDNPRQVRSTIRSLATLAYGDQRRSRFGRQQLIAALRILQNGDVDVSQMTGSWAGAMGHTQFIPTSYQAWAVDMDGNGRRDIWNSVADALGSAANLLRDNGWRTGHTWGYEVTLPEGRRFPGGTMTLAEWQNIGVVRPNGQPYPRPNDRAELKVLQGRDGPAFLVLHNFNMLKRYNNSDRYALAVGILADQIAGFDIPQRDWDRPFTRLSFQETQELQQRLARMGYYDGEIDGRIGPASRAAIEAFQQRQGLPTDGHPSMEVLSTLRSR